MTMLTTANQLTLLRMFLIPAFVILTVYDHGAWALAVFMLAGVTDGLDGWFARRGQQTALGAFLDPMADKLLLVTTFIVLTLPGIGLVNRMPLWLTILVISRDVVIVLTVAIVTITMGKRKFTPSVYGKWATAVYILTCVVVMFFNVLGHPSPVVTLAIYLSLALTLVSGIHYIVHAARIINQAHT
jgi:cardiolipin synthase (CMP-forming)